MSDFKAKTDLRGLLLREGREGKKGGDERGGEGKGRGEGRTKQRLQRVTLPANVTVAGQGRIQSLPLGGRSPCRAPLLSPPLPSPPLLTTSPHSSPPSLLPSPVPSRPSPPFPILPLSPSLSPPSPPLPLLPSLSLPSPGRGGPGVLRRKILKF